MKKIIISVLLASYGFTSVVMAEGNQKRNQYSYEYQQKQEEQAKNQYKKQHQYKNGNSYQGTSQNMANMYSSGMHMGMGSGGRNR